jgi:hypothetical protein
MILQTKIPAKKQAKNLINYQSKIFLVGSCFSENIGNKLEYYKFKAAQNPFGILFHPKAIENLFANAVNNKRYLSEDIIFQNERWHSFDAHSSLSSTDKKNVLETLNSAISFTQKELKAATHIIITLGTSWVYKFVETNTIVANCHKIPQKKFIKKLLTVHEITQSLKNSITAIKSINSKASVTFTVSPVRHLKDGFVENQRSKAHLIAAVHEVLYIPNVSYFSSYEIMMDELRDYRFYAQDMLHPNKTAINYIWEKFVETCFADESLVTMKQVETIQKGILHKPFNKNSEEHQKFLENLALKKELLKAQFSFIKF